MGAWHLDDDKVLLDADRCIGCGLCVTTCPTGAISLVRKPEVEQREVPKDMIKTSIKLGQARGKLNAARLVTMAVKSKMDRILAPR